jgi:hypothetical protein
MRESCRNELHRHGTAPPTNKNTKLAPLQALCV